MAFATKIAALGICLGLLCTGCGAGENSSQPPAEGFAQSFTSTANIRYGEIEAQAVVERKIPQSCTVTFTSPEQLEDLKLVMESDQLHLSYRDLGFDITPDSMPSEAMIKLMLMAINAASKEEGISVSMDNDVVKITGTTEGEEFVLSYQRKDRHILSLEIPDKDFYMDFDNFILLGEEE